MKEVISVLERLEKESSNKVKLRILEENKDIYRLKEILEYTYNPFKRYGITEKTFENIITEKSISNFNNIFEVADRLSISNINNSLRVLVVSLVESLPNEDEKKWAKRMLCKDLKIGITSTTINKVWPELIPVFDVQLATSIEKFNIDFFHGKKMYVTEKFDGIRCVCIIRNIYDIKLYSRSGKEILGLNDVIKDIRKFKEDNNLKDGIVLDGELLKVNPNNLNSGDLYRGTVSIVNSKSLDKKDIEFNIFDWLALKDFEFGKSSLSYHDRRVDLDLLENNTEFIKIAPIIYYGSDLNKVLEIGQEFIASGKEGIMINLDEKYECKRVKHLIKVKGIYTVDLEVVDIERGTGRNKNRLGALVCRYKDGTTVNIGSGFTDREREDLWVDDFIIGSIVEIRYTEESKNKNGEYSLRFPRFMGKRLDKEVADY